MVPPLSQVFVRFFSSSGEHISSQVLSNTSPYPASMYALNELESELFEVELKPILLHLNYE
ncbi:hypothetical protein B7492_11815 [Bacillus mycoides]|uniref:Uncharacterized protein n=2 Tax=Bacillus mycoides TaxID=1405 RepID=A0A1W6AH66_BACMY|nr:hypothetical protein B7492_11815 [Bacillus mycoides]TKI72905.1 hypothetical protein FC701_37345 [Bacillus mycoides]